jgi:hypothetical protein
MMSKWTVTASRWKTAKPMVAGLVIGLLVGPLLTNYLGWQVTDGSARAQVHSAVVEAKASVCNARARGEVAEPAKLEWSARNALAQKWAVMPGGTTADTGVANACSGKLAT